LGNLDGIKHLVNVGKIRYHAPGTGVTLSIDPVVEHPTTIISNQSGEGANYLFSHKNSRFDITGISGGGTIRLAQGSFDSFQAAHFDFKFFGSDEQDRFVVESAPNQFHQSDNDKDIVVIGEPAASGSFQIHGLGGDDTVLLGGAGNHTKSVDNVGVDVSFFGGAGTDRFIMNNQDAIVSADNEAVARAEYHINNGEIFAGPDLSRRSANFDDATEIVRINGASNHANSISIVPSSSTQFSIFADDQAGIFDRLSIGEVDGFFEDFGDNVGSFRPDGDLFPVYFEGIEIRGRFFARR